MVRSCLVHGRNLTETSGFIEYFSTQYGAFVGEHRSAFKTSGHQDLSIRQYGTIVHSSRFCHIPGKSHVRRISIVYVVQIYNERIVPGRNGNDIVIAICRCSPGL